MSECAGKLTAYLCRAAEGPTTIVNYHDVFILSGYQSLLAYYLGCYCVLPWYVDVFILLPGCQSLLSYYLVCLCHFELPWYVDVLSLEVIFPIVWLSIFVGAPFLASHCYIISARVVKCLARVVKCLVDKWFESWQANSSESLRIDVAVLDQYLVDSTKKLKSLFPSWADLTAFTTFFSTYHLWGGQVFDVQQV